jgi:serine/threonine protein kinase
LKHNKSWAIPLDVEKTHVNGKSLMSVVDEVRIVKVLAGTFPAKLRRAQLKNRKDAFDTRRPLAPSVDILDVKVVAESSGSSNALLKVANEAPFGSLSTVSIGRKFRQAPYRVIDGLGQGGYGVVIKVAHEENGIEYAVKVISKSLSSKEHQEQHKTELKVMSQIESSPFIQRCFAAFESDSSIFFVLEFIEGGDLFHYLVDRINRTGGGFQEAEARAILAEVVLGVEHRKLSSVNRSIVPKVNMVTVTNLFSFALSSGSPQQLLHSS